jgi:hypothetical protein
VQELAGGEIVEGAGAAAIAECRLQPVARARRHGRLGAGIGRARLERDVDHAGLPEAVLRRQGARDQRHLARVLGGQRVGEQGQAFGQLHAVQPVLQVAVVAAHMKLAEAVLRHAGRAQDHLVDRRLLAQRDGLDDAAREVIARGAEARLDRAARLVELCGGDGDGGQRRIGGRSGRRLGRRRRRRQRRAQRHRSPPPTSHRLPSLPVALNVIS